MPEERMGWERTAYLALGGALGALAGVLLAAWIIHVTRKGT